MCTLRNKRFPIVEREPCSPCSPVPSNSSSPWSLLLQLHPCPGSRSDQGELELLGTGLPPNIPRCSWHFCHSPPPLVFLSLSASCKHAPSFITMTHSHPVLHPQEAGPSPPAPPSLAFSFIQGRHFNLGSCSLVLSSNIPD